MYQYLRAIVKESGRMGRWTEADVAQRIISEIYHEYREVYLVVTHPALGGEEKALRLRDVSVHLQANQSTLTVANWLRENGGVGLPLLDEIPEVSTVFAPYRDAWMAGYNIDPVALGVHHETPMTLAERPHLRLSKEGVNYQQLFDECLVTVNGLFHRTNYTHDGLQVMDGARSGIHANRQQVGLYRLGTLGKLTSYPIEDRHIHKGAENQKLGEYTYVTLDEDVDLEGKTVMFVISGYLHPAGQTYSRAGDRTFLLDFRNYPMAQRFLEARHLLDYSAVEDKLSKSSVNPDHVVVEELYSDEVIRAMLTLSQSFVVVIDTPDIFVERQQLEYMGLPGRYTSYELPRYPMVVALGRLAEYRSHHEVDRYVLSCMEDFETYYNFETTQWKRDFSIDASREPFRMYDYTHAYFLKIGKDL